MLRTIMVSMGLAAGLAFAACDNGDDGNGSTAGTFGTGGEDDDSSDEDEDGEEEESAEESSESSAEGSSEATGTPDTTTGSECTDADDCIGDDDCPGGGTCVSCMCIGGTDDPTGDPTGDPTNSDYGPCAGGCAPGEMPVGIMNVDGCFCSPTCAGMGSACPAPNDGTAMPLCALETMPGAGPSQCALVCTSSDMCPTGATCEDAGGASLCMHPAA